MNLRQTTLRWLGVALGVVASAGKVAEAKHEKHLASSKSKAEDGKPQLQVVDAVGVFKLSYVDCQPYVGPEQVISIEEDGVIECFRQDDGGFEKNSSDLRKRRPLGQLRSGTLLKGDVEPASDFRSHGGESKARIAGLRMQLVNMPGGPGMWFALRSDRDSCWDEIYVRLGEESGNEFQTLSRGTSA